MLRLLFHLSHFLDGYIYIFIICSNIVLWYIWLAFNENTTHATWLTWTFCLSKSCYILIRNAWNSSFLLLFRSCILCDICHGTYMWIAYLHKRPICVKYDVSCTLIYLCFLYVVLFWGQLVFTQMHCFLFGMILK